MDKTPNLTLPSIKPVEIKFYSSYTLNYDTDLNFKQKMQHYEIDIITKGTAHLVIDNDTYFFKSGEICFRKPEQINNHIYDSDYECLHFKFDVVFPQDIPDFMSQIPTHITDSIENGLYDIILTLRKHYLSDNIYDMLRTEALLANFMASLYLQVYPQKRLIYHQTIQRATDLIRKHVSTPLLVEELAAYCGYSPKYFQKIFKETTGMTPHQYQLKERLAFSKKILLSTDIPISQVALTAGFFNPSHFNLVFKKNVGITPQQFRTEHK